MVTWANAARLFRVAGAPDSAYPMETREMSADLLLRGGTVVDGTGAAAAVADVAVDARPRRGDRRGRHRGRWHPHRRRRRPGRRAGVRGPAHALRRAAAVGPDGEPVAAARGDDRVRRELRVRPRARGCEQHRLPRAAHGTRRGHPAPRHRGRRAVELARLRRIPRPARDGRHRGQRRIPRGALRAAPPGDGRGRDRQRGHRRPGRRDAGAAAGRARRGRDRLLQLAGAHAQRRQRRPGAVAVRVT